MILYLTYFCKCFLSSGLHHLYFALLPSNSSTFIYLYAPSIHHLSQHLEWSISNANRNETLIKPYHNPGILKLYLRLLQSDFFQTSIFSPFCCLPVCLFVCLSRLKCCNAHLIIPVFQTSFIVLYAFLPVSVQFHILYSFLSLYPFDSG